MEYQKKIINLLENTPNQPSKFRTKTWSERSDDSHGMYNTTNRVFQIALRGGGKSPPPLATGEEL